MLKGKLLELKEEDIRKNEDLAAEYNQIAWEVKYAPIFQHIPVDIELMRK